MSQPFPTEIIVSLYEKKYHFGIASLVNSLYSNGFSGLVLVFYKDFIPVWVSQLKNLNEGFYTLDAVNIKFIKVDSQFHLGYYKPFALQYALDEFPCVEKVYYFDPDITINSPWCYFSNWVENGISLCLDNCFPFVHRNHPWRKEWRALCEVDSLNEIDYYVNSGFIGMNRENEILIERWIEATYKYIKSGGDTTKFEKDGHRAIKGDQDLLNAVITVSPDMNFSIIGQEGMGFSQPAYLMNHAVGDVKPWGKSFIRYLIRRGITPCFSDRNYIKYANYPIKVYTNLTFKLKKIDLKIASILGRIIG